MLKIVHLGLGKMTFVEGRPHVRDGLCEGFHCTREIRIQFL